MGLKKSQKGDISVENNAGRIRLRWRHNRKRFVLYLPLSYSPENMKSASVKVAEIKPDIMKGCFDTTLVKYKPEIAQSTPDTLPLPPPLLPVHLHQLANRFHDWTVEIRNMDINNSFDYLCTKRWLEKCVDIPIIQLPAKMATQKWAVITYNRRLSFLNSFLSWLVTLGELNINPLQHVAKRKYNKKSKCARRAPLSEDEIISLLEAVKNDTFCPKKASYKHSFYYPFLSFLFYTGVRNAEAIGLRVKHIDFSQGRVEISEVLARTVKGTSHTARIRKGTKTGNTRYIPLTDELAEILLPLTFGKTPDDLVFLSPKNVCIDDRLLQKRVLKPILLKLGIDNRDLYAGRHSFGTRGVQQGMSITDVAYLMGHSTVETTIRSYVSVSKPAVSLPSLKKQQ